MLDELFALSQPMSFWLNSIGFLFFLGFASWASFGRSNWPGGKPLGLILDQPWAGHRNGLLAAHEA